MMFFGAIYFMVPRLTGNAWASAGMTSAHRILVVSGVVLSLVTLTVAGLTQGDDLLDAKVSLAHIFSSIRLSLLMNSGAQILLLGANLMLLANFVRSIAPRRANATTAPALFRQPSNKMEAHAL